MKRIVIATAIILALMVSIIGVYAAAKQTTKSGAGCPMMQSKTTACPMAQSGKSATCPMMNGQGASCPMSKAECKAKMANGTCPMTKDCKTKAQCDAKMAAADKCCPQHGAKTAPKVAKKVVSAVCPVMGNKIPDITKAAGKSVYKGKAYYFCCPSCKPAFDKNPAKYVKK